MKYKVYMVTGGVMEQPERAEINHMIVEADGPDAAIEKWVAKYASRYSSTLTRGKDGKGWRDYYPIKCEPVFDDLGSPVPALTLEDYKNISEWYSECKGNGPNFSESEKKTADIIHHIIYGLEGKG